MYITFTPGEKPPASKLNNIGAWTAYAPALTNVTGADAVGAWTRIGGTVAFWAQFTLLAGFSITGLIGIALPVVATIPPRRGLLDGQALDLSANNAFQLLVEANTTRADLYAANASGTYLSRTATTTNIPFAAAVGDIYGIGGLYNA